MNIAIMQPYLFPYLGYFQLVAAVDRFVFYDDVKFIKNGWINRNRLLLSGDVRYFTVPLYGASPFRPILEVGVQREGPWRRKLIESIRQSYSRAPHAGPVLELATSVLEKDDVGIAGMARQSVIAVARYLDIDVEFIPSSTVYGNQALSGAERVLDICQRERASCYYNLPGGATLYDQATFRAAGIELRFIEPYLPAYPQGSASFQPGLSILDALMWNDRSDVAAMLAPRQDAAPPATGGRLP